MSRRTGFLALSVMASAAIHAALVPEHLHEMPRLGVSFIVAAVLGALLACALVTWPERRGLQVRAGLFCLLQIATWGLFVALAVPGFDGTPEAVEPIALICKGVEALAVILAFAPRAVVNRPAAPIAARGRAAVRRGRPGRSATAR